MNSPLGAPDVAGGVGRGVDAVRHVRQRRGVLVAGRAAPNPSPVRSTRRGASLGFERGALGLPTSGEIQEPQWIVQNFQHGTLNFDREKGTVTRVIDGVPLELPPPPAEGAAGAARAVHPAINP